MPPRYSYWTIIADGLPTAFRAAERAELEPTFNRLRERHPDAVMKWFARGKLWDSPDDARRRDDAGTGRPGQPKGRPLERGDRPRDDGQRRGRDWRPGGEHRDPRQKFKDAKKARNVERRHQKFARKHAQPHDGAPFPQRPHERPHERPRQAWGDRPPRAKTHGDARGAWADRPFKQRPPGAPSGRPKWPAANTDWRGGARPREDRGKGRLKAAPTREDRPPMNQWRREDHRGKERLKAAPAVGDRPPLNQWRREDHRGKRPHNAAPTTERAKAAPTGHRPPREKPHGDPLRRGGRPFDRKRFPRSQGTEEPHAPPRPRSPNREPRPDEIPAPSPPPRPTEPVIMPPGPPERGGRRGNKRRS